MLDYIKKELASRRAITEEPTKAVEPEDIPSSVLLECAHLFQELDDLTADGTNANSTRDFGGIDIPLEDDLEIETVEVNIGDGRVVDVPGDATAPTVKESYYDNIKKYDEFVTEAASMIHQLPRESDEVYNARVSKLADKLYSEYSTHMALVTNNGFEKISMESAEIPSSVKINFGKVDDSENAPSFMTKIKAYFDTDKNYMISRKQLDSLKLALDGGFQRMVAPLKAYVESHNNIPDGLGLWDVCTPTRVIVPKGTNDTFCVVLEYTNEISGKDEYFGWTASTQLFQEGIEKIRKRVAELKETSKENGSESDKGSSNTKKRSFEEVIEDCNKLTKVLDDMKAFLDSQSKKPYATWSAEEKKKYAELTEKLQQCKRPDFNYESCVIDLDSDEKINMESFVSGTYVTKEQAIHGIEANAKAEKMKAPRPMPTRSYYQEAIDFGSDSTAAPDGDDAPPAADDAAPSVDVDASAGSDTDVSTDSSDAADTNVDAADKETATVNDVSSEIAEKVAEKTENETPNNDADSVGDDFDSTSATFDDDMSDTSMDDTASTDDAGASVDDQLNELDTLANGDSDTDTDTGLDSVDDTDFDNMTIDEIIQSGSEKLKGMTLDQIKAFIKDNPEEAVQEAFFITKKNVDKEIDAKLRDCLGILNDNKMSIDTLIKAFKGSAHKLNRVLTKAGRLKNVYNADETKKISTLNKSLVDLLMQLKKAKDTKNVSAVKRQILVFTSNANTVAKFVEDRINAKTVQEAALVQEGVFLTPNNVKHKLAKEIKIIYPDLKAIVESYKNDRLTRGKINKIYRAGSKSSQLNISSDSLSYSSGKTHVAKTTGYRNLDDLVQTLNKVVRKNKVKSAFSDSDLGVIDEILDLFDEYIDGVEGVVYDDASGDVKTVVQNIGKTASKLIDKLSEFYGICSDGDSLEDVKSDEEMPDDADKNYDDENGYDSDGDDSFEDEGSDDVEGVEDDESLTEAEDDAEDSDDDDEGDED